MLDAILAVRSKDAKNDKHPQVTALVVQIQNLTQAEMVEVLKTQYIDQQSILHVAAAKGLKVVVEAWIEKLKTVYSNKEILKAFIFATDAKGNTPLHLAALYGEQETAMVLVNAGKDAGFPEVELPIITIPNDLLDRDFLYGQSTRSKLICIDFDKTLTRLHTGEVLRWKLSASLSDQDGIKFLAGPKKVPNSPVLTEIIREIFDDGQGVKNGLAMAQAMKDAIDRGHKVAIVSFSLYPEIVKQMLIKILALDARQNDQYIEQIHIVVGYPSHLSYGKQQHIQILRMFLTLAQNTFLPQDILLIDDDKKNIDIAKAQGMMTALVPQEEAAQTSDKQYIEYLKACTWKNVRVQPALTDNSCSFGSTVLNHSNHDKTQDNDQEQNRYNNNSSDKKPRLTTSGSIA